MKFNFKGLQRHSCENRKDMNLRKIAGQKKLTDNNPQQTLFAEDVTPTKTLYPPESKREKIEEKFENLIHEELN